MEGCPVKIQNPVSDVILEEVRDQWVHKQVTSRYPIHEEQRITYENIAKLAASEATTAEFSAYNAYIETVKTES